MIRLLVVLVIVSLEVGEVPALEHDFKATGTGHVAVFPEAQDGSKKDVISFLQIKPDLALQYDTAWAPA